MGVIRKDLLVIKRPSIIGDDPGVAEFGAPKPLRLPSRREPQKDTVDKSAMRYLETSAVNRALHFGYGIGSISKVKVHFPNGEHYKDRVFDEDHWERYGNMEAERTRLNFMLDTYGAQRGFPEYFEPFVQQALSPDTVLQTWGVLSPRVAKTAEGIYKSIKNEMVAKKSVDSVAAHYGYTNAFDSAPVLYTTSPRVTGGEKVLWEAALTQIASEAQAGNYTNVRSFLDLYGRIKDPISAVTSTLDSQKNIFVGLLNRAKKELARQGITSLADERGKTLLTQLALESSFLALPAAKNIFYVRADGNHHELPYVYVDLKTLPRGEFTDPKFALPQLENILQDSKAVGKPLITPIAVSYFQTPGESSPALFIVDGNNRSTALMTLRYLEATRVPFAERANPDTIRKYVRTHKLHPGWERELTLMLKALPEATYNEAMSDNTRLKQLVAARVPALLVQEPNFHTIAVEPSEKYRPEIYLLQPMHQAIYNHDELAMAIPPKKQTHGRAPANNILVEATRAPKLGKLRRAYRIKEQPAQLLAA